MPDPVKIDISIRAVMKPATLERVQRWIPDGVQYTGSVTSTGGDERWDVLLDLTGITTDQAQDIMHEIGKPDA